MIALIRNLLLLFGCFALTLSTLSAQQVKVGPTVTISADAPTDPHGESFFAINPTNSNDEIAGSRRISGELGMGISGYVTHDGGNTWSRIKLPEQMAHTWDVITYFDAQGNAYFGGNDRNGLWIIRSADAGRTWSQPLLLPGIRAFDRQQMGFDATGRFAGRIYAAGTGHDSGSFEGKEHGILAIAFSVDGAKTFGQPHLITSSGNERISGPINVVVTPDGTVVVPFWTITVPDTPSLFDPDSSKKPIQMDWGLRIATSGDGGNTYSVSASALTSKVQSRGSFFENQKTQGVGFAAADLSRGPYRGRIYLVWVELSGDHHDIRVIHSSDDGKTWSRAVTVNDSTGPVTNANPTIAVNNRGVVGVTWNDRRSHEDDCYDLYFSASLDGGETFLPNVTTGRRPTCPLAPGNWKPSASVSPYPGTEAGVSVEGQGLNVLMISTRFPGGGDTQGLDSDSDGVFHAGWIDGSSGVMQLATTTFSVVGAAQKAARNGIDVSTQVKLVAEHCAFEWKDKTFTCRMHLDNKSQLPVSGPFAIELQKMSVNLTGFRVTNADNDRPGEGARWNFATAELAPHATSAERLFQWQFTGIPKGPDYPFMMFRVLSMHSDESVSIHGTVTEGQ